MAGKFTRNMKLLERRLADNKSSTPFFVGDTLTVADIKFAAGCDYLSSGAIDHVSKDWLSKNFPKLQAAYEKINKEIEARIK